MKPEFIEKGVKYPRVLYKLYKNAMNTQPNRAGCDIGL